MKPRLSTATTVSARCPSHSSAKRSSISPNAAASLSNVVMSRNITPGLGKSGTSRMRDRSAATRAGSAVFKPGLSTDVEAAVAPRLQRQALHVLDARERRTLLEQRLELREARVLSLGDHLHGAVRQVPHVARQAELFGALQREVAIAHSLDAATHAIPIAPHPPARGTLANGPPKRNGRGVAQ